MRQIGEKRDYLKAARKDKGLSVRQIAPMIGASFSHYSDIENGRRNPSVELSMKIAEFFDMDLTTLLKDRIRFKKEVS
jgi:transcriptional regulator with XRE-family HTH domain